MTPLRAVVGILSRQEKMLVGQRPPDKPYSGYWEFPGGKIEANESGQEALIRELYEELGIHVITAHFWFEHTHTYPDKTVLLEIWRVTDFAGEPYGRENQVLRWVVPSQLNELRLLEGNWSILDKLQSFTPSH